jgi:hypothetical protein
MLLAVACAARSLEAAAGRKDNQPAADPAKRKTRQERVGEGGSSVQEEDSRKYASFGREIAAAES